jgi:hypothetical protein
MAKQKGIIRLRGSLHGKTYFKVKEGYYVKTKSSLDKERFDTDPAFEGSRKRAGDTKITAPLASLVYWQLPKKLQKHGMIGKMIGEAGRLLRAGFAEAEIINRLFLKFNV